MKNYHKIVILIVFLSKALVFYSPEANATNCNLRSLLASLRLGINSSQKFKANAGKLVYKGPVINDLEKLKIPFSILKEHEVVEIRKLGAGQSKAGGTVYRVIPNNGDSYVVKTYIYISSAKADQKALNWLREMTGKNKTANFRTVGFKLSQTNKKIMILEDVQGKDLRELLLGNELNIFEKSRLRKKYLALLEKVNKNLQTSYPSEDAMIGMDLGTVPSDVDLPHLIFNFHNSNTDIPQLFIKPDNIIVNPRTLEFTIIDPY